MPPAPSLVPSEHTPPSGSKLQVLFELQKLYCRKSHPELGNLKPDHHVKNAFTATLGGHFHNTTFLVPVGRQTTVATVQHTMHTFMLHARLYVERSRLHNVMVVQLKSFVSPASLPYSCQQSIGEAYEAFITGARRGTRFSQRDRNHHDPPVPQPYGSYYCKRFSTSTFLES